MACAVYVAFRAMRMTSWPALPAAVVTAAWIVACVQPAPPPTRYVAACAVDDRQSDAARAAARRRPVLSVNTLDASCPRNGGSEARNEVGRHAAPRGPADFFHPERDTFVHVSTWRTPTPRA